MNHARTVSRSQLAVGLCIVLLLPAVACFAQVRPGPVRPTRHGVVVAESPSDEATVSKIIRVQARDLHELVQVLGVLVRKCEFVGSQNLGIIVVRGPAGEVEKVEEVCRDLDAALAAPPAQPPTRNVEVRLYFVEATDQEAGESAMPAALTDIANSLKADFGYAECHLVDTLLVRCQDGREVEASGFLPGEDEGQAPSVRMIAEEVSVETDVQGEMIRFRNLVLGAVVQVRTPATRPGDPNVPVRPGRIERRDIGLKTHTDVRPGRKVLVGKVNVDGAHRTLFLVIEANVVD